MVSKTSTRIPGNWTTRMLAEVSEIKTGGTPSKDESAFWGGNIPWMASGDVHLKRIKDVKGRITELGLKNSNARLLPPGTVMMAMNGQGKTRGTVAVLESSVTCNQSLAGIIPQSDIITSDFLFYNLESRYQEIRNLTGDGTRTGLNLKLIGDIQVKLPSLPEQHKIAAILKSVDDAITATQRIIDQTEVVKRGLMQQLLTKGIGHTTFKQTEIGETPMEWMEVRFDDIVEFLTDYEANGSFADVKNNVRVYDELNFAYYVRATDLEKEDYVNGVKYTDEASYSFLRKTKLVGGELLITKRGQIGKVYLMPYLGIPATLGPNLYLIKLDSKLALAKYVYYYLLSVGNKSLVMNSASTTLGALYKKDVKAIKMLIPPLEEQKVIVHMLDGICDKVRVEERTKYHLTRLKSALMRVLLTGKARVNVNKLSEVSV